MKYTSAYLRHDAKRGKWQGFLRYKNEDGKWRQVSKTFAPTVKTQRQAEKELQDWRAKMEVEAATAIEALPSSRTKVAEYVSAYIDTLEAASTVRPSAISDYRTSCKRISEGIGDVAMGDLTPAMIQAWENDLLKAGKGVNTVLKYHRLLNSVFKHAVNTRDLDWNPCPAVKKPKRLSPSPNSLSAAQQARLVKSLLMMGPSRTATAAAIAVLTGMRAGEVCGLKWKCYDPQAATIHVVNAVAKAGGKTYESEPKTDAGRRDVPVDPLLTAFLEQRRNAMAEKLQEGGVTLTDSEFGELYVVGHEDGRYFDPTMLSRSWKMVSEMFDLVGTRGRLCTFHDLRHTFATIAIASGADVVAVSKTLGHASPSVTMNVYADALPEGKRRAVALVGESIASQGNVEPFALLAQST